MIRFFIALWAAAQTAYAAETTPGPELKWLEHSVAKETLTAATLKEKLEPQEVTVWEPHEGREANYRGFSLRELLTKIYGPDWKAADELAVTNKSGLQNIEIARLKTADAFLVFEKIASEKLTVANREKGGEALDVGPFYLAWDNLKSREIRRRGTDGWLAGITSFDLLLYSDKNPRAAPPKRSKPAVKAGFVVFRSQCLSCHTINGEGGGKGPELNYPASVTEYLTPAWLTRWMLDPASVRFNTTMPGLPDALPNRKEMAKDVVAYLKAMAGTKQNPSAAP